MRASYIEEVVKLLTDLLIDVVRIRQPEIEPVLKGKALTAEGNRELLLRSLQTQGIGFQLLNIAEQNAAMRRRRQVATERGLDKVQGTFAHVLADAAAAGVSAQEIQSLLSGARVRPVITAHPTEAKRVTVLEIHRRIYLLLMQLETPRWTPRERAELVEELRTEIDLLWLTGEIRLEKPTVDQEVVWGLHFFNDSLFEGVARVYGKLEQALEEHYPDETFDLPAFFQFGSWIGGDRDGNPFVTNEVTRSALLSNRGACLQRYNQRLRTLVTRLSIAEHAIRPPAAFASALDIVLERSGERAAITARNPGEIFRQFAVCMLAKLDATIAVDANEQSVPNDKAYRRADELVDDLRIMERGLIDAQCASLARSTVRPLRREVEIFGFRTVSLDLRENTTTTNAALAEIWRLTTGQPDSAPPDPASTDWKQWVLAQLAQPLEDGPPFDANILSEKARSTLGMLGLVAWSPGRRRPWIARQ